MCCWLPRAVVTTPFPVTVLILSSMAVVVDLEETQSLTTTTNYVLHHLGHSKLVKKGKVREDVKQACTSGWYLSILCSYHRNQGQHAGCCWKKVSCNLITALTTMF
jgi:hypothetical protein